MLGVLRVTQASSVIYTNLSTKYLMTCKVYTDVGGIKWLYRLCPPVRKKIHSLRLVDYLHVQVDKPWYNYYVFVGTLPSHHLRSWIISTYRWTSHGITITCPSHHHQKILDYLHVQADKPWYNYYVFAGTLPSYQHQKTLDYLHVQADKTWYKYYLFAGT